MLQAYHWTRRNPLCDTKAQENLVAACGAGRGCGSGDAEGLPEELSLFIGASPTFGQ